MVKSAIYVRRSVGSAVSCRAKCDAGAKRDLHEQNVRSVTWAGQGESRPCVGTLLIGYNQSHFPSPHSAMTAD